MGPNNSQWQLTSDHAQKANSRDMRNSDMKTRKVRSDRNKHCHRKEQKLYA